MFILSRRHKSSAKRVGGIRALEGEFQSDVAEEGLCSWAAQQSFLIVLAIGSVLSFALPLTATVLGAPLAMPRTCLLSLALAGLFAVLHHARPNIEWDTAVLLIYMFVIIGLMGILERVGLFSTSGVPDWRRLISEGLLLLANMVIVNVIAPKVVTLWRGGNLLYPTRRQLLKHRVALLAKAAIACFGLVLLVRLGPGGAAR